MKKNMIGLGLLIIAFLIVKTENPLIHAYYIWNFKDSQFEILETVYSPDTIQGMQELFDRPYSYVELITWIHSILNWTDEKPNPVPKDPFSIINLGEGKCGEFSILYISACIANGYDCRIVQILRGNNHQWVEVKINGTWIHVDPTYSPSNIMINDPLVYHRNNYTLNLVVAFERESYEVVTKIYAD